jgi:hypothetical protein
MPEIIDRNNNSTIAGPDGEGIAAAVPAQDVIDIHMRTVLQEVRQTGTLENQMDKMIHQRGASQWDIPALINMLRDQGIVVPKHINVDSFETVWDPHTSQRKPRQDTVVLRVKRDVEGHEQFTSSAIKVYQLLIVSAVLID